MKIGLKDPSKKNISINLSSTIKSQLNIILEMKKHIESSANFPITLNKVPEDSKSDNNPDVVVICENAQSKNSQNTSNSNNELLKYSNEKNYLDITDEFNIDKEIIETNQNEVSSFLSTNFELSESDFGFLDEDDENIIFTEDDLIWSMETETWI